MILEICHDEGNTIELSNLAVRLFEKGQCQGIEWSRADPRVMEVTLKYRERLDEFLTHIPPGYTVQEKERE